MIITRTPFRMSFLGGGTDYRPYFEEHGGSVISTTMNKFCYVTVRHLPPFFEHTHQITYAKVERPHTTDEIEHPLVREAIRYLDMRELSLMYEADLPGRSGLGTSSSFAVGMLQAFYAMKGKYVDKNRLAQDAIYVERELCRESGGIQDQIAVAFGGLNRIDFSSSGFYVKPVIISNERKRLFNDHLMLFFTGFSRISSNVARAQADATKDKTQELKEIHRLVDDGERILTSKEDICEFGKLLDYTWRLKRGLTDKISNDTIDALYAKALQSGAIGGKLLGAGGGGFLLLFAEPERQDKIKEVLSDLLYVPFQFEDDGCQVLYYTPEDYIVANPNKDFVTK